MGRRRASLRRPPLPAGAAANSPPSLQRPHPPILIGGGGERRTLRLVAQYADACNLFAYNPALLDHKLAVLRGHCEAVGRPYEEIEKTSLGRLHVTRDGRDGSLDAAGAIRVLEGLAERGIDHAIFGMPNVHQEEPFEVLTSEVIPAAERMRVAGR